MRKLGADRPRELTHNGIHYSVVGTDPWILQGRVTGLIYPAGRYILRHDPDASCLYVEVLGKNADRDDRRAVPVWMYPTQGDPVRPLPQDGLRGVESDSHPILEDQPFEGSPQAGSPDLSSTLAAADMPSSCGDVTTLAFIARPAPTRPS